MKPTRRRGFSLLEVLLATTVLLGCVLVLSHIAFVGRDHMESADSLATAQLVCQTRMNEMLAGAAPLQEVGSEPIAELPGWGLSVRVNAADQPGLLSLEVTALERSDATMIQTAEPVSGKQFSLVRWIAEPPDSSPLARQLRARRQTPVPDDFLLPDGIPGAADPFSTEAGLLPEDAPLPELPPIDNAELFGEPFPDI